jgi:hypothetical protein
MGRVGVLRAIVHEHVLGIRGRMQPLCEMFIRVCVCVSECVCVRVCVCMCVCASCLRCGKHTINQTGVNVRRRANYAYTY